MGYHDHAYDIDIAHDHDAPSFNLYNFRAGPRPAYACAYACACTCTCTCTCGPCLGARPAMAMGTVRVPVRTGARARAVRRRHINIDIAYLILLILSFKLAIARTYIRVQIYTCMQIHGYVTGIAYVRYVNYNVNPAGRRAGARARRAPIAIDRDIDGHMHARAISIVTAAARRAARCRSQRLMNMHIHARSTVRHPWAACRTVRHPWATCRIRTRTVRHPWATCRTVRHPWAACMHAYDGQHVWHASRAPAPAHGMDGSTRTS